MARERRPCPHARRSRRSLPRGDRALSPTKFVVCGAAGRMGRLLVQLLREDPHAALAGAVEAADHPFLGSDAGEIAGGAPLGIPIVSDYESLAGSSAVTLDFTVAAAAIEHLRVAARNRARIVVGTTGFSPTERAEAERLAEEIPTILAANMSVGVNVLLKLVSEAARLLGSGFDPEIVEIHHRLKVDAPSGTALALAESVAGAIGRDLEGARISGRDGMIGKRGDAELGVLAVRGGDVVGDHTVYFLGRGERLELTHRAQSRECLARGAIRAGHWLARTSKPGRYSMADVLGLA